MNFYVYQYITPINITLGKRITIFANQPFYIGKGTGKRWKDHILPNKIANKQQNWMKWGIIKHIREVGLEPHIEIITENLTENNAFELEKELIKKYGRICNRTGILTNITEGGEGASGWNPSESTRKLWSEQRTGKPNKLKGSKRPGIGGRTKGYKWSERERNIQLAARNTPKFSAAHKTPEFRKKMSDLKMGWKGSATGKIWFNNGIVETYSFICPEGFTKGRLPKKQFGKRGLLWYNNGKVNRQFKENYQEEGFKRGKISKK